MRPRPAAPHAAAAALGGLLLAGPVGATTLDVPPLRAGRAVTLSIADAPPAAEVHLLRGSGPGPRRCADAGDPCADVSDPVLLGITRTDDQGRASLTVRLPDHLPWADAALQAWIQGAPSAVVTRPLLDVLGPPDRARLLEGDAVRQAARHVWRVEASPLVLDTTDLGWRRVEAAWELVGVAGEGELVFVDRSGVRFHLDTPSLRRAPALTRARPGAHLDWRTPTGSLGALHADDGAVLEVSAPAAVAAGDLRLAPQSAIVLDARRLERIGAATLDAPAVLRVEGPLVHADALSLSAWRGDPDDDCAVEGVLSAGAMVHDLVDGVCRLPDLQQVRGTASLSSPVMPDSPRLWAVDTLDLHGTTLPASITWPNLVVARRVSLTDAPGVGFLSLRTLVEVRDGGLGGLTLDGVPWLGAVDLPSLARVDALTVRQAPALDSCVVDALAVAVDGPLVCEGVPIDPACPGVCVP